MNSHSIEYAEFLSIDNMENLDGQKEIDEFFKNATKMPCTLYAEQCLLLFEIEVKDKKFYFEVGVR